MTCPNILTPVLLGVFPVGAVGVRGPMPSGMGARMARLGPLPPNVVVGRSALAGRPGQRRGNPPTDFT